jgi:RimJ/RimL family protein N-acetyltransferase
MPISIAGSVRASRAPEGMWKVDLDAQGWGLATEAMTAITTWFDSARPGRTVCMIDPDNLVSIRVASKLGFIEFERTTYKDTPIVLFERLTAPR